MQYHMIQFNTMQYHTMPCNTMQVYVPFWPLGPKKRPFLGHRREKTNRRLRRHRNFSSFTPWNNSDWCINGPLRRVRMFGCTVHRTFERTNPTTQKHFLRQIVHCQIVLYGGWDGGSCKKNSTKIDFCTFSRGVLTLGLGWVWGVV